MKTDEKFKGITIFPECCGRIPTFFNNDYFRDSKPKITQHAKFAFTRNLPKMLPFGNNLVKVFDKTGISVDSLSVKN